MKKIEKIKIKKKGGQSFFLSSPRDYLVDCLLSDIIYPPVQGHPLAPVIIIIYPPVQGHPIAPVIIIIYPQSRDTH